MILKNDKYQVEFSLIGAEIISFKDKDLNIEYIWSGDETYWAGRNPILFPVIGSSFNRKYYFDNAEYEMGNHGFLRRAEFQFVSQRDNTLTLKYLSNSETLKQYPYQFEVYVTYELLNSTLKISYQVKNTDYKPLPFNFGLHPAFNCPLFKGEKFQDYWVEFSNKNEVYSNLWENKKEVIKLPLDYESFKKQRTWSFTGMSSSEIIYTNGNHGAKVGIVGFPIVAVWTPMAPFVCLEPWLGLGRKTESQIEFSKRDATALVETGKSRFITYHITVF